MNDLVIRPLPVVIDGQNVAGYALNSDGWNWQLVIDIATFHHAEGSRVHVVVPVWIEKSFIKELGLVAEIIKFTPIGKFDKEGDDKLALGRAALIDGFIITNDKKIGKHTRGDLLTREWCASHRIGFSFGDEGYQPIYPKLWTRAIQPNIQD